ncbi:MAG: hypothetical protein M1281_15140 [Chloroflexi bacterium]|nr:hypothetical protein [Chloroflexota bacterium]
MNPFRQDPNKNPFLFNPMVEAMVICGNTLAINDPHCKLMNYHPTGWTIDFRVMDYLCQPDKNYPIIRSIAIYDGISRKVYKAKTEEVLSFSLALEDGDHVLPLTNFSVEDI